MVSKIEWLSRPGTIPESWNFIGGCSPKSAGCLNCWAARMAATRLKHHSRYEGLTCWKDGRPTWTGEIRLDWDALDKPLSWKKPRTVFVASTSDLFHEDVPNDAIRYAWATMAACPQHTFLVLTKRLERIRPWLETNWLPFPILSNVWLGVTVENQQVADERIPILLQTPAAVRFVSYEPALSVVDFSPYLPQTCAVHNEVHKNGRNCLRRRDDQPICLDWLVAGGESGPRARPMHPDWARKVRDDCQAAGIPFHFKQWGSWIPPWQSVAIPEQATKCWLDVRGQSSPTYSAMMHEPSALYKVGKKAAGRLLDGKEWNEWPG